MKKYCLKQFTLIELLVVIAIIGILASMLLPVLGKARKSSQTSLSINNLKQISISVMIYADNNNGVLFNSDSNYHPRNNTNSTNWSRMVYEGMFGMFSFNSATARDEMDNDSRYKKMMYCPVLLPERESIVSSQHGRSAYSLNRYFGKDSDDFTLNNLSGKIEPFIIPGTASSNSNDAHADIDFRGSRLELSNGYPAYAYNGKTLALYLAGHVETMSPGYGGSIDAIVNDRDDFQ